MKKMKTLALGAALATISITSAFAATTPVSPTLQGQDQVRVASVDTVSVETSVLGDKEQDVQKATVVNQTKVNQSEENERLSVSKETNLVPASTSVVKEGSVKQIPTKDVKQISAKDVEQVSAKDIKKVSTKNVKKEDVKVTKQANVQLATPKDIVAVQKEAARTAR